MRSTQKVYFYEDNLWTEQVWIYVKEIIRQVTKINAPLYFSYPLRNYYCSKKAVCINAYHSKSFWTKEISYNKYLMKLYLLLQKNDYHCENKAQMLEVILFPAAEKMETVFYLTCYLLSSEKLIFQRCANICLENCNLFLSIRLIHWKFITGIQFVCLMCDFQTDNFSIFMRHHFSKHNWMELRSIKKQLKR